MTKHTILYRAANPLETERLALDVEARALQHELKGSDFELVTRWAVEPLDLLRELPDQKPMVVHFSGHGGQRAGASARTHRDVADLPSSPESIEESGLYFQGPDGRAQSVSADALAEAFRVAGASVKLVVLSAC
jgi:CHAT domain-containing protein